MMKQNNQRTQSGFTLTELAIVLGVMSIIVGAIWSASSSVSESRKESDAVTELQTVTQGILTLMGGQTFTATNEVTAAMITAQAIPSAYTDAAVPTAADNPWDNGVLAAPPAHSNRGLSVFVLGTGHSFRVVFYNVTNSGCINLLLQGTSCQTGQPGCPIEVYTRQGVITCQPNQTNCTGAVPTTGPGWGIMTPTAASIMCANNITGNNSVEFDYSLQ